MEHNIYIYILVAAAVSCLIRVLPLTLIRGKIKNPLIRSFLYYVPYVTLAVSVRDGSCLFFVGDSDRLYHTVKQKAELYFSDLVIQ